ncbi:MAG: hypothetical protein FWB98_02080 [Defluviitaleaceae bacterium]|nr:hypothetical protein [Defluviitaleaceae bacterium]
MNRKKILTGLMAFLMAFALIPSFQPTNVHANTVIAGQFATIPAGVPANANVTSVQGNGIDAHYMGGGMIGVNTTASQGGQTFVINVNYHVPGTAATAYTPAVPEFWGSRGVSLTVNYPPASNAEFTLMPHTAVELSPGQSQLITVTLRNTTAHAATQVSLLPRANPIPNFNVEVVGTGNFSMGANAQRDVQLRITPNATIIGEPTTIPVELSFRNNINQVQFATVNLPITMQDANDEQPRVIMSNFSVSQQNLAPGQSFSVTATLQNVSNVTAPNVQLRAEGFAPHLMIIGSATNFVGAIPAGQSRDVTFNFTSPSNLESGSRQITLNLTHDNADGVVVTTNLPQFVTITEDGALASERAHLDMSITAPTGSFRPGDEGHFSVIITNSGNHEARNVRLQALPTGVVPRLPTVATALTLAPGASQTFTFSFSPTMSTTAGFQNVEFQLEYNNGGEIRRFSQFNGMNVIADDDRDVALLSITSIQSPTGQFMAGEQANFRVTIANNGDAIARNVRLSASPEAGVVNSLASIQTVPSLGIGETRTFDFAFTPTDAATSRFHNIGFTLAYDDGNDRQTFEQFTGLTVYAVDEGDENRSRPRIIISDFTVDPMIVMANSEFELGIVIQNTHPSQVVQNIRVTWQVMGQVTSPGGGQTTQPTSVFTPVGASNTFHIQEIPPRGTYEHQMTLFAIPDAPASNHIIQFRFDYEDANATAIEAIEDVGVNVRQIARLEVGDPGIPADTFMGMPMMLSFHVHNTSRSNLYNVRVRFEGEGFNTAHADEIFGNMAPGHFGNFWENIIPEMPGQTTLYMIVTFEDAMAEPHEIITAFPVNIMGGMGGDFGGGGFDMFPPDGEFGFGFDIWGEEESGGLQPWVIILIVVGAVGVGTLTFFLVRRHIKRSGQFEDDDDF